MEFLNNLLIQWNVYWQIPMFRVILGALLMAGGIIYLQLNEARFSVGLIVTALGLFILFHGVSAKNVLGPGVKEPKAEKPAPPKPKPTWKIELASPTVR